MASFNRVILMGNLTRDPDVRSTGASGMKVARLGLAVNEARPYLAAAAEVFQQAQFRSSPQIWIFSTYSSSFCAYSISFS